TATAPGHDVTGADSDEVDQDLAGGGVLDDGAVGHGEHDVRAVGAVPVAALSLPAVAGPPMRAVVIVDQRGGARVDLQDHIAALAAVAAVGAAERLELLAVDGGAAVPAVTRLDMQDDPVHEAGHL